MAGGGRGRGVRLCGPEGHPGHPAGARQEHARQTRPRLQSHPRDPDRDRGPDSRRGPGQPVARPHHLCRAVPAARVCMYVCMYVRGGQDRVDGLQSIDNNSSIEYVTVSVSSSSGQGGQGEGPRPGDRPGPCRCRCRCGRPQQQQQQQQQHTWPQPEPQPEQGEAQEQEPAVERLRGAAGLHRQAQQGRSGWTVLSVPHELYSPCPCVVLSVCCVVRVCVVCVLYCQVVDDLRFVDRAARTETFCIEMEKFNSHPSDTGTHSLSHTYILAAFIQTCCTYYAYYITL